MRLCIVDGCQNKYYTKSYCAKHLANYKRNGFIAPTNREPRLAKIIDGQTMLQIGVGAKYGYAIVDPDYKHLEKYKWSLNAGYPMTHINNERTYLHHLVVGKKDGMVVDHISGDKLDNRKSNLRHTTHAKNILNQVRAVGAYYSPEKKKWYSKIHILGKNNWLGYYQTKEEARAAYLAAKNEYLK